MNEAPDRDKADDHSLIRNALDGDQEAFEELVKKYESLVAATVIGMLGPGPEAEDIGQDTFIRFYKAMKGFRGDSAVGTYLTRIAINLCLNEIKRRVRRRQLFAGNGEEKMEFLADNPRTEHRNEAARLVHQGLLRLPAKYRSVIVLRLVDGYSTQETAEILSLPQGTVLSRLARAQKKLREILTPFYEDNKLTSGDGHE